MNTGILDRPIAFHRCFVTLTGSVNASLMLSQAVYWQKRNKEGGSWFQTREKWEDEIGLSRAEQETARKLLKKLSFWKEELQGVPAKLYYCVDLDALMEQLFALPSSNQESSQPEGGNQANKEEGIKPSPNKEKRLNEETYLIPSLAKSGVKLKPPKSEIDPKALEIYKTYPRRVARVDAIEAIAKALQNHEFDYLLDRTSKYAQCVANWPKEDFRFVPYPATWFNADRFDDDEREWIRNAPVESFQYLQQKAFAIRNAIQSHVANREYIGAKDDPSDDEIKNLRGLRAQLAQVEAKMVTPCQ